MTPDPNPVSQHTLLRNFAIELIIYGALVAGYFYLVLRYLREPLADLFHSDLAVYAFACLGLVVIQGVLLDTLTSFLVDLLGLHRLE